MSHSAKAANRIKQEAGFPSCFPDETLILAVFNNEELYNSKSKLTPARSEVQLKALAIEIQFTE